MMMPPDTSSKFDKAYRAPLTMWGDVRVPEEIRTMARMEAGRRVLEFGCGVGRLSRFMTQQGLHATGVDFSPVAIAKARKRVAGDDLKPEFLVGDVTCLDSLEGPFDASFDVGCFHCLNTEGQRAYVSEVSRLLRPGGAHLLWAMDSAPSGIPLSPGAIKSIFVPGFDLQEAQKSRRRFAQSHWYWLIRR